MLKFLDRHFTAIVISGIISLTLCQLYPNLKPENKKIDILKSELIEFKVLGFEHVYMKNPDTGIFSYVLHLNTTAGVLFGFDNSNINIIRIGQKYVAGVKGKEIIQMFCGLGYDTADKYKIERKIVSLDVCEEKK